MDRASLRQLRRSPGYARFYGAATLARLSNEMFAVAVVLFVLERTGSAWLAGASVAAVTFPSLVSGPVLGSLLDRTARRVALLGLDQAVMAATLAGIALTAGSGPGWALPLVALAGGITFPLSVGGFTSLIPALAPREARVAANALEAASFNLAVVGGPALAGTVAALAGPSRALLVELALKLAALVLTATVRDPARGRSRGSGASILQDVWAGFRHVADTGPLLAITVAGALSMAGRGLLVVAFPFFAVEALGVDRSFAGYLWGALAAGSVAGALGLARLQGRMTSERLVLDALAAGGVAMLAWPLAGSPAVALGVVALAGVALGPSLAATFTVRQEWTPAELHGQVFLTAASLKVGSFALGAAFGGLTVGGLGPAGALLLAAVGQLAAFAFGSLILRRAPRLRPT